MKTKVIRNNRHPLSGWFFILISRLLMLVAPIGALNTPPATSLFQATVKAAYLRLSFGGVTGSSQIPSQGWGRRLQGHTADQHKHTLITFLNKTGNRRSRVVT